MGERLTDRRESNTVTYPVGDWLRTAVLLVGQAGATSATAAACGTVRSFRGGNDSRRGTAALEQDGVLPLQRKVSRLVNVFSASAGGARPPRPEPAAPAYRQSAG